MFVEIFMVGSIRSRSLILVPIESAYCDFPLVRYSNLGPVLQHIAGFFVLLTPPLFHPNLLFWGCVLVRNCTTSEIAHVGVSLMSRYLKLFSREIFNENRSILSVAVTQNHGELLKVTAL